MPNPFSDLGVSDADFDAEMNSDEVLNGKIKLAEKAAAYWRRIAPIGDPATDPHSTEYVRSIHVTVDGFNVDVGSDDEKANLIEYGSVNNPEYACRAQVQAKFRLSEGD